MNLPRRVVAKGREGVVATVAVTTYRGDVWMSIVPPFSWDVIMEIGKVDELIQVLAMAREDARRSVTLAAGRADHGGNVVREIRNRPDG